MDNKALTFLDAFLSGDYSGAIERSEKREQQETVRHQRLPIKSNDSNVPYEIRQAGVTEEMEWEEKFKVREVNNKKWTKEQYEKMGIIVTSIHDDLFLNVQLPNGWEIKPTDHSMWNEVFDEKGRKRITFFYKGAFYDRSAHSTFEKRYTCSVVPFDHYQTEATYEERESKEWYGIVYDGSKEIFRTKGMLREGRSWPNEILYQQCKEFLNEHFSQWEDMNAYWKE